MKIWIINHYALKSSEAGGTRHHDLGKQLHKDGHKVRIFSSSFLHYKYKWRYAKKKNAIEEAEGVCFHWLWTLPYKGNGLARILNMLTFFVHVVMRGLILREKPDAVIGSSVHLFSCLAAYILSRLKGSLYIVEIRDLWPKTLIDLGAMSEKGIPARLFGALERFVYKKADRIVVLLPGAVNYIEDLGFDRQKIYYLPNGIDLERQEMMDYESSLSEEMRNIRRRYKHITMYMGSHGIANALDTIVEAAAHPLNRHTAFVLVGDGPEKQSLMKKAEQMQNVFFFPSVSKNEVYSTLNLADVLLISMMDSPLYNYGISLNKLFDYLLVGKPILFAGKVLNDIVGEAGAGMTVSPQDAERFTEGIRILTNLREDEKETIKRNAFHYVKEHHDISRLAAKLAGICEKDKDDANYYQKQERGNRNEYTNA